MSKFGSSHFPSTQLWRINDQQPLQELPGTPTRNSRDEQQERLQHHFFSFFFAFLKIIPTPTLWPPTREDWQKKKFFLGMMTSGFRPCNIGIHRSPLPEHSPSVLEPLPECSRSVLDRFRSLEPLPEPGAASGTWRHFRNLESKLAERPGPSFGKFPEPGATSGT